MMKKTSFKKMLNLCSTMIVILLLSACDVNTPDQTPHPSRVPPFSISNPNPKGERILSMDITQGAGEDFSEVFQLAQSTGIQATSLSVYWDDIEQSPGVYDPNPNWLAIANQFYPAEGMRVSLTISVIDTTNLRLPSDLAEKPFDDEAVIQRFNQLLDYIHTQIPDLELTVLAIGNEIDVYLGDDKEQWQAYTTFYSATAKHARQLWPDIPIGTKTTFSGLLNSTGESIKAINQSSDVILVTYYPLDAGFAVRRPQTVHTDFAKLADNFPQRPIYLLEAGYPSGELNNSSERLQAEFVHELFQAWDKHAEQIGLISYVWLTDVPPEAVNLMSEYYDLYTPAFASFLGTLGLRTSEGDDKPAFLQWEAEARSRGW